MIRSWSLVRVPGGDDVVQLAGTGASVWAALDAGVRFDDLCDQLASRHDADPSRIAADLEPVLADLAERAVIRVDA